MHLTARSMIGEAPYDHGQSWNGHPRKDAQQRVKQAGLKK